MLLTAGSYQLTANKVQAQVTVPSAASVAPAGTVAPLEAPKPKPDVLGTPNGNSWRLLRIIKIPNPGAASLDRRGALYLTDADNNLRQYGAEGLPLNTYSPPQPGHTALVEAWNVTNTLVFYDDRQEILLLDRFLAPLSQLRLADYVDGMVRVATLAPDNQIWLLDESNLVLREFDPQTLRLVQNTPLDLIIGRTRPDFRFIRQYQNNTYLVDRTTGIYVFDNLGNYKKKLPFLGLSTVGFKGDELYYVSSGALHFFHLYNLTERTVALPATVPAEGVRQVLLGEGYAYVFTAEGVLVYQL
ncbi:hypothetical protein Q5H93_07380 [Hymenobacter sp. ASUV-10]|uniref:6-bladed beta-propeller n=1 Tax=Hymenobacter aranciens TaxID=3063996 RepID=A0ABT9B8M8_9BACT|nr:hypothetical protein [Hymenobacter sp. ASUV-10]MDO7874548.1 hypothetical protein [Hymenobacter sp. ASUV-10]